MRTLRDHYLRLDPRALGLFRVVLGLVLLGDLARRATVLEAFYSNAGLLPNHQNLALARGEVPVWSLLHAFSSVGESAFAFGLFGLVYTAFLLGFHTRVAHLLSLIALLSLEGRAIWLGNAGGGLALALLALTAFLPLGASLSWDSVRASLRALPEKTAAELNAHVSRSEGWRAHRDAPASLASLGVLLQLALVYASLAWAHRGGSWSDGSALHYALHAGSGVSCLGALLAKAPALVLGALSWAMRGVELVLPLLLLVPLAAGRGRGLASKLMAAHGLFLGLFFQEGLLGWALLAASFLVLPREGGARARAKARATRPRLTVLYDADCGVCLLSARLLARADVHGLLTFQGNDDVLDAEGRRTLHRPQGRVPLPVEVSDELLERSFVVVQAKPGGDAHVRSRGEALLELTRVLPLGGLLRAWLWLHKPLLNPLYDAFAKRRLRTSERLGLGACGVARGPAGSSPPNFEPSPARALLRKVLAWPRELSATALVLALVVQAGRANALPGLQALPQPRPLQAITGWLRLGQDFTWLREVSRDAGRFALEAQTRSGKKLDVLTGDIPVADPRGATGPGQLWTSYFERFRQAGKQVADRPLRDWSSRGGLVPDAAGSDPIVGLDLVWLAAPIAPPGAPKSVVPPTRTVVLNHLRGGIPSSLPRPRPSHDRLLLDR